MALCIAASASAQQINPITRAMLNGYTEILKSNPKDYQTLYERAAQYYQISQYDNALNDLTKAIEYTPAKDKDMRLSEFSLLADAAVETKNYELALDAINSALNLQSDNYANIYKKGNILLYLNRPEEAYRVFSTLQSLKSRSQEAYFGMAKAAIMQEKFTEAEDLMKEAEKADPTGALTYCRLGDLYLDMNQPENAATNYLVAFSLGDNSNDRALSALIRLANTNYSAVAMALDFAIDKSENKIPMLYLKGMIAERSGNYSQAAQALEQLISFPEGRSAGVYMTYAKALLALNRLQEAQQNIGFSINSNPSEEAYIIASQVALAQNNLTEGVRYATNALSANPQSPDAFYQAALAQIAAGDKDGALTTLNELVMYAPDNMPALLLRAYVQEQLHNNGKGAVGDFNRIIMETPSDAQSVAIKGIAQAKTGKKLDADATIANGLLSDNASDKNNLYWAAVYYAQTGDLAKAEEYVEKAITAGYQDEFNLKTADTPWMTIAPIRHLIK